MTVAGAERDLVAGIGFRSTATTEDIVSLVHAALAKTGRDARRLGTIATIKKKRLSSVLYEAAERLGCRVAILDEADLAAQPAKQSDQVKAAVGVGSVAEAAALSFGSLIVDKQASDCVTCAISEIDRP
jgi:cobalamin biosynthesis protein CbiG